MPCSGRNSVFAGVRIGRDEAKQAAWVKESGREAGARDPYTRDLLAGHGVALSLTGCATLTFDRFRGPRTGRYSIDVEPLADSTPLTNRIGPLSWAEQWQLALGRLDQLRHAEIVYTNRLHVILPCLAFGTPVFFPSASSSKIRSKRRLTILGAMGFEYDTDVVIDTNAWSETYRQFLTTALNIRLKAVESPALPETIEPQTQRGDLWPGGRSRAFQASGRQILPRMVQAVKTRLRRFRTANHPR